MITLPLFARVAGVSVDVLINDELDLPKEVPSSRNFQGDRKISWVQRRRLKASLIAVFCL
jgi:hypothetical protein